MELGVLDRLVVLQLLPPESDVTTLRIIRDLKTALSFSEEEHLIIEFQHIDTKLTGFNHDVVKDIEIGPRALALIVGRLEELNKQKKIPLEFLSTYEKFVE